MHLCICHNNSLQTPNKKHPQCEKCIFGWLQKLIAMKFDQYIFLCERQRVLRICCMFIWHSCRYKSALTKRHAQHRLMDINKRVRSTTKSFAWNSLLRLFFVFYPVVALLPCCIFNACAEWAFAIRISTQFSLGPKPKTTAVVPCFRAIVVIVFELFRLFLPYRISGRAKVMYEIHN